MSPSTLLISPLVLARAVHFTACVAAAGTAAFAVLVADGASEAAPAIDRLRRRWRAIIRLAALVAGLSGAAWLAVVAATILGTSMAEAVVGGGLWSVATGTQFGHFAVARIALALLLLAPVWRPRLHLAAAFALLGLIAPAGHAGAQPGSWGDLHLAADVVHLLAAGAWLGGLPALAMLLDAARRNADALAVTAARTTARFSWVGIICVGLLIASGVVNAWFLLSGPADLVTSTYGRVLALKIVLFAAMLVLAAINRFRLAPRLPDAQATRRLQQNSIAESCLGLGVLVLAAVLGTLEPTAHHHRHTLIPTEAAFVHIHTNIVMADVTIDPGRVASVQATIHLAKEDFSNFSARAVRFELNPPDADVASITRDARDDGDSVWRVDGFELPRPGIWTIRLSVAPQHGAIVLLDAPIVIAP